MLPGFETGRLLLRPRSMADFEACLAMDRDPEVTRYVPGPWDDPVRHERFLAERIGKAWGPGLGYWSIFPKDGPVRFVGWILLIPLDGAGPDVEIGWRLNRASWGRGYATEAAGPVVRHAFATVGLDRIVARIDPANAPSMRVAEKLGLNRVGDIEADGAIKASYVLDADDFVAA